MSRKLLKVESPANPTFKKLKSLLTSKGIKKEGQCLVSGNKIVAERLKHPDQVASVIRSSHHIANPTLNLIDRDPKLTHVTEIELSPALFRELDEIGTNEPLLLLELKALPTRDLSTVPQGIELICPVGDPLNLGSIARSAKAFGVRKLLLTREASNPFLPKAMKTSAGALLDLEIELLPGDLWTCLKTLCEGPRTQKCVFGLDLEGESLPRWQAPNDLFLVCGEEGRGLPEVKGLNKITIPIEGVESLNAGVATALALYHVKNGRMKLE